MCQSSWKLYLDDFPFLGSSLAHLEPKLELFEFWEFRSWWLYVLFCLQNYLTTRPDPSRYPNFFASTRPVPSRSKKPLPVGPCRGSMKMFENSAKLPHIAKDCLLTGQEQTCRINWLSSPCRKLPNTQENGCWLPRVITSKVKPFSRQDQERGMKGLVLIIIKA